MKKIGLIFLILCAYIMHITLFTQYNESYSQSIHVPGYEDAHDKSYIYNSGSVYFEELNVSSSQVVDKLSQYYKDNDLSGYILLNYPDYTKTEIVRVNKYYINSGDLDVYSPYYYQSNEFPKLDSINKIGYVSNIQDDKDAVNTFSYLDDSYYQLDADGSSNKIYYYPMGALDTNAFDDVSYLNYVYYTKEKDSEFISQDIFKQVFLDACINKEGSNNCGRASGSESVLSEIVDSFDLSIYNNIFNFPSSLLIVSLVVLFILVINEIFKNAKEITIRSLHGNSQLKIFNKLFLPMILTYSLIFVFTVMALILKDAGTYRPISSLFINAMVSNALVYLLGFVITSIISYFVLMISSKMDRLKYNMKSAIVYFISLGLKSVVFIIILLPAFSSLNSHLTIRNIRSSIEENNLYNQGAIVATFANYSDSLETQIQTLGLVWEMLETYDIKYIDNSNIGSFANNELQFSVMNKSAIDSFNLKMVDNSLINTENLNKSTLFIPNIYRNDIEEGKISSPLVEDYGFDFKYIEASPRLVDVYFGNVHNDKAIVYLDSNDINLLGVLDQSIHLDTDLGILTNKSNLFLEEVENKIGTAILFDKEDLHQNWKNKEKKSLLTMVAALISLLILMVLFTVLGFMTYYDYNYKEISIKYMSGFSIFERFFGLLTLDLIINILAISFAIMRNSGIAILDIDSMSMKFIVYVGIGLILMSYLINFILIKTTFKVEELKKG